MDQLHIGVMVFDGFEPLDVFGPIEVLGCLGHIDNSPVQTDVRLVSRQGNLVHGRYGVCVSTGRLQQDDVDVLLIPG